MFLEMKPRAMATGQITTDESMKYGRNEIKLFTLIVTTYLIHLLVVDANSDGFYFSK